MRDTTERGELLAKAYWLLPALALCLCVITQASAEVREAARPLPPRPDYVTAWPKQVPVEKPDPVLGDKPFWEIWTYSTEFAKRFKGFPVEGADTDFSPGAQAFVFRVYKEAIFKDYPEQYRCEYDFYFDSSIRIPLSDKPTWVYKYRYPTGVTESYVRLDPVNESDHQTLRAAKPAPFDVRQRSVILSDGPLDGRFATFGVAYYPDLAPGLAMARLPAFFNCEALAPKLDTIHFWLSLFGHRPYKEGSLSTAVHGSHMRGMKGSFDPGSEPIKEGYFRVPEAFYRTVLPKVTLVKVLNDCVRYHHAYTLPNKGSPESWAKLFSACKEIEERGVIYSFPFSNVVKGLDELGF